MIRVGHGMDVHRLVEGRKLILCGIEVPYHLGLLGHSDADVAAHALMDAMLGAAAMGDIGKLFPDTDEQYRGADSIELLKVVCAKIAEKGYKLGLISEERYNALLEKIKLIEEETARVEKITIAPSKELSAVLEEAGTAPTTTGCRLSELLKRPQLSYKLLTPFDKKRPDLPREVFEQVEINLKYAGYIKRQLAQVEEQKRLEVKKIPENINYDEITNLRLEAIEKLKKIRPETIGQASRISGVSPADIAVLLIYLKK